MLSLYLHLPNYLTCHHFLGRRSWLGTPPSMVPWALTSSVPAMCNHCCFSVGCLSIGSCWKRRPGSVDHPLSARWGLECTQGTCPCIWVLLEGGVWQQLSLPRGGLLMAYLTSVLSRASFSPPAVQVPCFPAPGLHPWGSSIPEHRGSGLREGRLTVPRTLAGDTAHWTSRGW